MSTIGPNVTINTRHFNIFQFSSQ